MNGFAVNTRMVKIYRVYLRIYEKFIHILTMCLEINYSEMRI